MRVEANISVSDTDAFGTKVEVKNLNSFKSVEGAIDFEIKRQIESIERGEKVIQETRGWDEVKGKTFSQRIKESANDYRYFPDPDLPKLNTTLSEELSVSSLSETMPMLPEDKRSKYNDLGITREQIELIISDIEVDSFFNKALEVASYNPESAKLIANYLTSNLFPLRAEGVSMNSWHYENFVELIEMIRSNEINSRIAKDLLADVVLMGQDPRKIATERGLLQTSSDETLLPIVISLIEANPQVVSEYKNGKESALQFLVGQGMRLSKGSANPKILLELIRKHLS